MNGQLSKIDTRKINELNGDQYDALLDIIEWSKTKGPGHILIGFAGAGKTHLIKIISQILTNAVLCAPTNKAVKELKKLDTGLKCCTIYSLLGLKMQQFEDTIKLSIEDAHIPEFNFVILDECGMTNFELYGHIERAMDYGIRFLFVGDPKQLPPVGEIRSPIWNSFDSSVLSIVMRHDNQILKLATRVRKTKIRDLTLYSDHKDNEGVWALSRTSFEIRLQKYASNGVFETNTKAIAWRNKTVDYLNQIIRREIHGDQIYDQKYIVGDRIVFTSPYIVADHQMFTDDEALITGVRVAPHRDYRLQCYHLTIKFEKREYVVQAIHETGQSDLDHRLNQMADEARRPKCRHLWKNFWDLRNSLCDLKYAYAITAHRSQGSTYDHVFVDVPDILTNPNRNEARKCLYVAVTRPSKKLFLIK